MRCYNHFNGTLIFFGGRDLVGLLNITIEDHRSRKVDKVACVFGSALLGFGEPNFYRPLVTPAALLCLKFWRATCISPVL